LNKFSHLRLFLEEIRYEQTLFSLPLIYVGAIYGSNFQLTLRTAILIAFAAASARAAGMLINRIVDVSIDRLNPRTRQRHLAAGRFTITQALAFLFLTLTVYICAAYLLGPLPLKLSWIPVLMFVIYPYTKRFTWACHFFLGLTHGLAPLAGWIAVNPQFSLLPLLLYATSFFWVSGFDIYYATMDYEFDRQHKLYSFPSQFGLATSARVAIGLHVIAAASILLFSFVAGTSLVFKSLVVLAVLFLLLNDLKYLRHLGTSQINSYLQRNSYFSVIIFAGALVEFLLKRL